MEIFIKLLLQAVKSIAKSKAKNLAKQKVFAKVMRKMTSKVGISKEIRFAKQVINFMKAEDKVDKVLRKVSYTTTLTGRMYDLYKAQKEKEWSKILRKIGKMQTEFEQSMIRKFKEGEGISQTDFINFRNIMMNSLNEKEKGYFKHLFGEKLRLIFRSSWIMFGIYIPYGRRNQSGILALQLYEGSERNPSGFYQWIRIPRYVWEQLEFNPNGETWWREWYHDNRKNKRYLTKQSIHYKKDK